jgi:ribonuclease HII
LAGPIVAAAVVLSEPVTGLNDSKQLTEAAREALFEVLHAGAHTIGVSIIGPEAIDAMGIQPANYKAMLDAAAQLMPRADFLLVDGFRLPDCVIPHHRIVKGDCLSQSIAAASIVAKVTRDRIMVDMDRRYPGYGFAQHKGYCTRMHLEAVDRLGPCPIHRRSFAPLAQALVTGSLFASRTVERVP